MTEEQLAQELIDIAENVPKVYESGKEAIRTDLEPINETVESVLYGTGDRATFWDLYQNYGNRKTYQFGFAGGGWTNSTFNPKYSIVLSGGYPYAMFWMSGISGDLEEICEEKGITIDFTGALSMNYCFSQANLLKSVGFVDVSCAEKNVMQTFGYNSGIETIRVFKVREEQTYSTPFVGCTSLKNITIEGVIGNNFPINQSPLTHESIMSIINHLGTYSTTKTLSLGSTNLAKLTDAEKAIATERGWTLA